MTRGIIIVGMEHEEHEGRRIARLASFAGSERPQCLSANSEPARVADVLRAGHDDVICSSAALRHLSPWLRDLGSSNPHPDESRGALIVHGFDGTPSEAEFLAGFTHGQVTGAKPLELTRATCTLPAAGKPLFGPLAGLCIDVEPSGALCTFSVAASSEDTRPFEAFINIDGRPLYLRLLISNARVSFLGTTAPPDLDLSVPEETDVLSRFFGLLPWLACIRSLLGERAWTSDSAQACFIIDDPLLKLRHGFLDYRKLLGVMQHRRFSTSLAFIPWNFRRTDIRVADLFNNSPRQFSLCVHGCDHTAAEFGATDVPLLREKALLALDRMDSHRKRFGVSFDSVMVFPQGIFSTGAIQALKISSYVAAVNSTAYPVDMPGGKLPLSELLDVAVTRFSGFPLFTRRYPSELPALAFDLFLGKPAFIVEHHQYFREGYEPLAAAVEKLNALADPLHWTKLADICTRASVRRVSERGEREVRFYTDRFLLNNDSPSPQEYVLFRKQSESDPCTRVTIVGGGENRTAPFELEGSFIKTGVTVGPGQSIEVRIERNATTSPGVAPRPKLFYKMGVFVRRHLCEFRDNYVDTNSHIRTALSTMRGMLRKRDRSRSPAQSASGRDGS